MHTTVADVDLEARQVTLRVTKNGRTRAVFINELTMQVFVAMGLRDRKRRKDRRTLFPNVTPEQLSMRFIRACRDAGVEDFSLHDLRHTYASHLRMNGADLDDIRRLLGHSDLRMTIQYSHLLPEHLEAAASSLMVCCPCRAPGEPADKEERDDPRAGVNPFVRDHSVAEG